MEVLLFYAPDAVDSNLLGEDTTIVNPTADQIVELLRRKSAYWGTDSGDASLAWHRADTTDSGCSAYVRLEDRPSLSIIYHEPNGFHFAYTDGSTGPFLVPFDARLSVGRVMHSIGGEQACFPLSTFVSLGTAETVIRDFIATGKPSPAIEWKSGPDLRCGDTGG